MTKPILPSYSSSENLVFHPAFKYAAEQAITSKGLNTIVEIVGQYPSPTGPVDFVLINKNTQRVILPIEIKRTQTSVRGPGRRQARDYWSNLGSLCSTPFYCCSNLELTEVFRHDSHRPRTSAQRIKLSNPHAGILGTTPEQDFYGQLISTLEEVLDLIFGNVASVYVTGLVQFQANIEGVVQNPPEWHKLFVPACFEYIRGAASKIQQLSNRITSWRIADFFQGNPQRLNQLGSALDFEHVFTLPSPDVSDPVAFAQAVLKEAYESGRELGQGDDIAELVNEALKPKSLGIVETDVELAQLLAVVGRDALGRDLQSHEEVLDPAAGSGRLLTALPLTVFPNLSPRQVKANEKEQLFAESLSLRLGLTFASVISPANAPTVTIAPIETINPADYSNVRLVVMNPPFMSGVQAASLKTPFVSRIRQISGMSSELNNGQIALEALFIELVWHLVQPGTVIATVFPFQHLSRGSDEVVTLRRFLVEKFGLTHVVIYPREGLFEDVIKQTVLLVGKKGTRQEHVKIVEVQKRVADVDFLEMLSNFNQTQPTHGVSIRTVTAADLLTSATVGWKGIFGAGALSQQFLQTYMQGFRSFESLGENVTRGPIGDHGNTALTVFTHDSAYPQVVQSIPTTWLRPALNTTKTMPRILTDATAPQKSFLPPQSAFQAGTTDNQLLRSIIRSFQAVYIPRHGSQARHAKTEDMIISDIEADQKNQGAGWVLIQRASRVKGEVALLEQTGILLSTNVLMVKLPTVRERELLASWVLSVFGQIQLEIIGTSQEGMRKLEMAPIKRMLFPDFSAIPPTIEPSLRSKLLTDPALCFGQIQVRMTDHLWADVIAPANASICLTQAFELFQQLVDERRGFGNS